MIGGNRMHNNITMQPIFTSLEGMNLVKVFVKLALIFFGIQLLQRAKSGASNRSLDTIHLKLSRGIIFDESLLDIFDVEHLYSSFS